MKDNNKQSKPTTNQFSSFVVPFSESRKLIELDEKWVMQVLSGNRNNMLHDMAETGSDE